MNASIEMRRLEALSDTVFGVAMTFLAYRLPLPGPPAGAPRWSTLLPQLGPHLAALVLGFSSAGLFWFSHHRRLALTLQPRRTTLLLNFVFLLLITILPVTTDMFGNYGVFGGDALGIYAVHLAALAALNLVLWLLTIGEARRLGESSLSWRLAIGSSFTTAVFTLAALLSFGHPGLAGLLLFTAFLAPIVGRLALGRAARA